MTRNGDGGPGLDPGAAIYADSTLDYLDTGRDLRAGPVAGAQLSRETPLSGGTASDVAETDSELLEAFGGAYALVVEVGDTRQVRRRLVMSLAAAERARLRAEDRGQRCRIALVRLELVAELDRERPDGGET